MAVDRIEREYHLTPRGWAVGTSKCMFTGCDEQPVPADRVLTVIHKTYQASRHSPEERSVRTQWVAPNVPQSVIEELRRRYPPPFDPEDE